MADPFDSIMDKHFEAAGIEDDPAPSGEQTTQGTGNETVPATSEETKLVGQDGKDIILDDAQPKHELKDKPSSKADSAEKPGEKKEGEVALSPGDLKLQDGTIVKAGAERRWFQRYENSRQEATLVRNELNQEKQSRQALETKLTALTDAAKAVGVADPQEMQTSLQLFRDLRDNPVGTVKALLTDLRAKGYNIDGIGSQVDTAVINRLLDQRGEPSVDATGPTAEQIQQEAVQEVRNFFQQFPDAVIHEDVINNFIVANAEKGVGVSLSDAYFTLKNAYADQGFDWSQPLAPQVEAKKSAQAPTTPVRPIPNGAVIPDNSTPLDQTKVNVQYDTFDDAIRSALSER